MSHKSPHDCAGHLHHQMRCDENDHFHDITLFDRFECKQTFPRFECKQTFPRFNVSNSFDWPTKLGS